MHSRDKAGVGLGASAGSDAYRHWWEVGATSFAVDPGHPGGDQTSCVRYYIDDNGDPHIEQLNYQEMFVDENLKNKYGKKWEGSYTKQIYDLLCDKFPPIGAPINTYEVRRRMLAAAELLQQYHDDLHVPYDQRDVARREALELRKEVLRLRKNLAAMVAVPLIDDLKMARGAAAACNLYGVVRAIDRAIEAL